MAYLSSDVSPTWRDRSSSKVDSASLTVRQRRNATARARQTAAARTVCRSRAAASALRAAQAAARLPANRSRLALAMLNAGHNLTVHFDGSQLEVANDQTGQVVGEQRVSRTSQVQIIGSGEDDWLTIELTARFALPFGIKFDGAGGHDQVNLVGGADGVSHLLNADGSGQVSFQSGSALGTLIIYSHVNQVVDALTAQTRAITVSGAGNDATVPDASDGITTRSRPRLANHSTSARRRKSVRRRQPLFASVRVKTAARWSAARTNFQLLKFLMIRSKVTIRKSMGLTGKSRHSKFTGLTRPETIVPIQETNVQIGTSRAELAANRKSI